MKKYGTLDDILTKGTGMNKDQRKNWRAEVDRMIAKAKKVRDKKGANSPEYKKLQAEATRLMMGG